MNRTTQFFTVDKPHFRPFQTGKNTGTEFSVHTLGGTAVKRMRTGICLIQQIRDFRESLFESHRPRRDLRKTAGGLFQIIRIAQPQYRRLSFSGNGTGSIGVGVNFPTGQACSGGNGGINGVDRFADQCGYSAWLFLTELLKNFVYRVRWFSIFHSQPVLFRRKVHTGTAVE